MRLSPHVLLQLVEGDHPKLVLLDRSEGAEIVLDTSAAQNLLGGLAYFAPAMGLNLGALFPGPDDSEDPRLVGQDPADARRDR